MPPSIHVTSLVIPASDVNYTLSGWDQIEIVKINAKAILYSFIHEDEDQNISFPNPLFNLNP
jgi:hypothetical protein